MSNSLTTFNFRDNNVRVVDIDGEPWFVVSDVCRALGVCIRHDGRVNTSAAIQKVRADEKQNLRYVEANRIGLQRIASRAYGVSLVSESGLYKLIMRSDKPAARAFQDWVTRDVLPAIRKTGAYAAPNASPEARLTSTT